MHTAQVTLTNMLLTTKSCTDVATQNSKVLTIEMSPSKAGFFFFLNKYAMRSHWFYPAEFEKFFVLLPLSLGRRGLV